MKIFLVDSNTERGGGFYQLFRESGISVDGSFGVHRLSSKLEPFDERILILAHCELLNGSFPDLAQLLATRRITFLFFTTDPHDRSRLTPIIPDDLSVLVSNIENWKNQKLDNSPLA